MNAEELYQYLTSPKMIDQTQKLIARNSYTELSNYIKKYAKVDFDTQYDIIDKLRENYSALETNPYIGKIAPKEYKPYQEPTPTKPVVKCPYCGSTDVKKISTTSRMVSVGVFGLASKKVGKQFHCNKCRADF